MLLVLTYSGLSLYLFQFVQLVDLFFHLIVYLIFLLFLSYGLHVPNSYMRRRSPFPLSNGAQAEQADTPRIKHWCQGLTKTREVHTAPNLRAASPLPGTRTRRIPVSKKTWNVSLLKNGLPCFLWALKPGANIAAQGILNSFR